MSEARHAPGQTRIDPDLPDTYPGTEWAVSLTPDLVGWSGAKLAEAYELAASIRSGAILIVQGGIVASSWGNVTTRVGIASMRKSLLSALIGIHQAKGTLDLSATLGELGIDDCHPSLTAQEKLATIEDLLVTRSGIYHAAADQDPARLPPRGSVPIGTRWHYNNWDFNVLAVILDRLTGVSLAEDFDRHIAGPLDMQDIRPGYVHYKRVPSSDHPVYKFRMSARDLARVGLLFLRDGRWRQDQIIPVAWVRTSTKPHAFVDGARGFGYSWWTGTYRLPDGDGSEPLEPALPFYWASGMGNQYMMVFPAIGTVIVHVVADTNNAPSDLEIRELHRRLMASRIAGMPVTSAITK